jgi:hypothetical protein
MKLERALSILNVKMYKTDAIYCYELDSTKYQSITELVLEGIFGFNATYYNEDTIHYIYNKLKVIEYGTNNTIDFSNGDEMDMHDQFFISVAHSNNLLFFYDGSNYTLSYSGEAVLEICESIIYSRIGDTSDLTGFFARLTRHAIKDPNFNFAKSLASINDSSMNNIQFSTNSEILPLPIILGEDPFRYNGTPINGVVGSIPMGEHFIHPRHITFSGEYTPGDTLSTTHHEIDFKEELDINVILNEAFLSKWEPRDFINLISSDVKRLWELQSKEEKSTEKKFIGCMTFMHQQNAAQFYGFIMDARSSHIKETFLSFFEDYDSDEVVYRYEIVTIKDSCQATMENIDAKVTCKNRDFFSATTSLESLRFITDSLDEEGKKYITFRILPKKVLRNFGGVILNRRTGLTENEILVLKEGAVVRAMGTNDRHIECRL